MVTYCGPGVNLAITSCAMECCGVANTKFKGILCTSPRSTTISQSINKFMMDGGGFRKGWNRLELSGLWPQLINSIAVIPYISRKPYMCCTGLSHKTRVRARAEAHYSYREMADHEDNIGIEVLLQTSLEGVPPDAQVSYSRDPQLY